MEIPSTLNKLQEHIFFQFWCYQITSLQTLSFTFKLIEFKTLKRMILISGLVQGSHDVLRKCQHLYENPLYNCSLHYDSAIPHTAMETLIIHVSTI